MRIILNANLSLLNKLNGIFNFLFWENCFILFNINYYPCSFHSSHSRLVISGSWVRACGSLNLLLSESLMTIIFWATWEDFGVLKCLIFLYNIIYLYQSGKSVVSCLECKHHLKVIQLINQIK